MEKKSNTLNRGDAVTTLHGKQAGSIGYVEHIEGNEVYVRFASGKFWFSLHQLKRWED